MQKARITPISGNNSETGYHKPARSNAIRQTARQSGSKPPIFQWLCSA